ncbi:MAG: hypothetical protein IPL08_10620 [Saprospiraceae bacterium]|nr:hypothetical protein [Saprospiraceae bacterium]
MPDGAYWKSQGSNTNENVTTLLGDMPVNVAFLSGSVKGKKRNYTRRSPKMVKSISSLARTPS